MLLCRMDRRDVTPHGFRSSFRDWCAERTAFPSDRFFKDETYKLSPEYRALLDDAIDISQDVTIPAVGLYGFLVVANELCIQHVR